MSRGLLNGFLTRNGRTLRRLCRIGFALSVLAITVLSLLPGEAMPRFRLSDKVGHFIAYAEIVMLGIFAYSARAAIAVLAGVAALGGLLELAQTFVPGRSADIVDFAVNCLGMLVGYAAARSAAAFSRA